MPEYLAPGVYVDEISRGPKPIEGVSTSVFAFLGETARGPVRPIQVTGLREYERWFGGAAGAGRYLPDAARAFFDNGGHRLFVARVASLAAMTAQADCGSGFTLRAAGPGSWGSRVFVLIGDGTARAASPSGSVPAGLRVRVAYYDAEPAGDPHDWFAAVAGAPAPAYSEDFDNLIFDRVSIDGSQGWLKDSSLVALDSSSSGLVGARPDRGLYRLGGGDDGFPAPGVADYQGRRQNQIDGPDGEPQGLAALSRDECREVSVVYAPAASVDVARALIEHCDALKYRFAIIDAGPAPLPTGFDPRSAVADSTRAALYYPWITIDDPAGVQQTRPVPPGGFIAGIYTRSDEQRGVHKAPANETLRGALGLTEDLGARDGDALNQRHVNVIRKLPNRGIRVWGARTLSSDPTWKYVNVRRLFIFLERSIDEGIAWAVFEPNAEPLWTAVRRAVSNFLATCWRDGALQGATEDQAFYVLCDRTTMTSDDIANGRLICLVGVAAVKPAEFVIFRIVRQVA